MALGYDSTHPLDHDALRTVHAVAVGRYLDNPAGHADDWKATGKAEDDGYGTAGFGRWYIWETTATRALDGYDAGVRDGQRARTVMRALGVPASVPAIATCDSGVAGSRTIAYGRGFRAAAGVIGIYGSAGVIDAWHADGLIGARYGWQTNAHGWDSPRRTSPHASMHQLLPVTLLHLGNIDPNDIDDDCPLIHWPASHPHPTPSTTEELSMSDIKTITDGLAKISRQLEDVKAGLGKAGRAVVLRDPRDHKAWIITDEGRWHVPDRATLNLLIWIGQVAAVDKIPLADPATLDKVPVLQAPPSAG
ncbi:MAG: hypothetical protein JWM89_1793 [Acidimicrobiales bacterium]|nr:hypothetical protein [Acidimicrobiales bacterium]